MNNNSTLAEFRQLGTGQLAVAGVAIAIISMILEFIALSGFAPRISGDENISSRRSDFPPTRRKKRKKLLETLAELDKLDQDDSFYLNTNLQTFIADRRSKWVPFARPLRPVFRPRPRPKVLYGVLRNVPKPPPKVDVVYPYGIGGDSIVDRLALNGNFDGFITTALATYFFNR